MPRAGLSRAAVVEAAGALADEGGLENLSLVDLAGRLGIRKPSLYNHVAGIGDLRRELALAGLQELGRSLSRAAAGKAGRRGALRARGGLQDLRQGEAWALRGYRTLLPALRPRQR